MLIILAACTKIQTSFFSPDDRVTGVNTTPGGSVGLLEDGSSSDKTDVGFVACLDCIEDNHSQLRYGIAVTDFNQDGDFEAVVTGYGHPNQVWDWQDGVMVDVAPANLRDPERKAIGVAACDVDGDGEEEIYFLNVDQFGGLGKVTDRLYDHREDGWVDLFERSENQEQVNQFSGRSVACIDRFRNGTYGIFVANYGGPMKIFEVTDGRITESGEAAGVALTTGGRALLSLPVFDSGMHMFAGNERGPNFLFRHQPDGTFKEVAEEVGISDAFETVRGATTLDVDGDGDFDLVYGNWEGPHRMWSWNVTAFEDVTAEDMRRPSRIRTVVAADFDNDGSEELFFNNIGEPNRFFRRESGGSWVVAPIGDALEPLGLGTGAAVLDFDNDGRLELLIAHGESGEQPLSLYRWPENDNHFLRVLPKTRFGAPARGAIVTVHAREKIHLRSIDAGSGYLCQMEPVAHVGLGADGYVEKVVVKWPDGTERVVEEPEVDTNLIVEYPDG